MKITFICHSSFLAETDSYLFLFDYFEGEVPALDPEKPLFVFASHSHGDHFHKRIFDIAHPLTTYVLSDDIRRKIPPADRGENMVFVKKNQRLTLGPLEVETLRSTDQGVAFCVASGGFSLYHGGDLNYWYWEGEDPAWLESQRVNYLGEMEKLKGRKFDLAFIPVDPRLGEYCTLGLTHFLEYADADLIFPMHMWGDFSLIGGLQPKEKIVKICRNASAFNQKGEKI